MEMIVVRVGRLAGERLESLDRFRGHVDTAGVVEQQGSKVLGYENALELSVLVLDESLEKQPGASNIERQGDVVVGVCEIAEVDAPATRIEERTDALDRLAVGTELVEQSVDVTPALVRTVVSDRPARLQAEIVDRHRQAPELAVDSRGRFEQRSDDLDRSVACRRIARRVEAQARRSQREWDAAD